jgi:HTH-type transcriptional regulator / antitoxin HigA
MDIHPIKNDRGHRAALAEIDRLWGAKAGTRAGDKLDILLVLTSDYEEKRWPIKEPSWDAVDVLNYAIEEMGHSQKELADLIGSPPHTSEILNRKRNLTVPMIHRISKTWKIPAALLVRPHKVPEDA